LGVGLSMGFVIRDCRPEEADAVLALWWQAETTVSLTDTVEDIERAIDRSPACVLVAEAENRIVGSVIAGFDGWRGSLYRLAVHPTYRRRGIARALVGEAERRLAVQGAKRITAMVEKDHSWATEFWSAVGYERDPRMTRFVRNV
jgi:ribosomal protein S18 acetylase RimI-like enzyme